MDRLSEESSQSPRALWPSDEKGLAVPAYFFIVASIILPLILGVIQGLVPALFRYFHLSATYILLPFP